MNGKWQTTKEILADMGGAEGFLALQKLTGPIDSACEELRQLMRRAESSGRFELQDYCDGAELLGRIEGFAAGLYANARAK